jgi:hypothetical protein
MVFFLVVDVLHQILQLAPTNREISVTALPLKGLIQIPLILNPGGRGFLYLLEQFGLGDGARQARGDVDMIGSATNTVRLAVARAANGGQVTVHTRPDIRVKPGVAALGAKDYVDDDLAE